MNWTPNRRNLLKTGAAAAALGFTGRTAWAQDIPTTPEAGAIKMGIEPWLGYGQWHIAAKKDLFKQAGLDTVEIINFTTDADINAALAAGQLQCGNIATHTAMNFIAAGLPFKIVALLDVSKTADAMISDGSVTDIKGLKGKQVAYEEGTTSDILLNYALSQNGMTIADIEKVPMPASDAGAALIAGKVPVAVTYEPYLTLAMNENPKVKMIYSAGENPGLISDVFVVREEFLKKSRARSWRCSRPGTRRSPTIARTRQAAAPSSRKPSAPSPRNWPPPSTASSIIRWPRTRRSLAETLPPRSFRKCRPRRAPPASCRRMST